MFVQPVNKLEQDVFDLWKQVYPDAAFINGLSEYAGKLFIPTEDAVKRMVTRIRELKVQVAESDRVTLKFLNDLDLSLQFREPFVPALYAVGTFPAYMAKEGFNATHLRQLADACVQLFECFRPLAKQEWPIEIKVFTTAECNGTLELLKVLKKNVRDARARKSFDGLARVVSAYKKPYAVKGVKRGDFAEVFPILKRQSRNALSRPKSYPWYLKDFYDFLEVPEEIERKALSWMVEEKPLLDAVVLKLAKTYKCRPNAEAVDVAMRKKYHLKPSKIVAITEELRKKAQPVFDKHLLRIAPKYDCRIVPVPDYLKFFFPAAGMMPLDILTDKPFSVFFINTDPKFNPPTTIPDILDLIVHEEYGHAVNFHNSAQQFVAKPTILELVSGHLSTPITEGMAFHWEMLSLRVLDSLVRKQDGELSVEEKAFLKALRKYGSLETFLQEYEFLVRKWRFLRFFRAICDVRVNTGAQSLAQFVEWAHDRTGIDKKIIFQQNVHFQEMPGYAPCYSVFGQSLRAIQDRALAAGADFVEFNTYVSSMGFPCRGVFESRLKRKYLEKVE